MNINRNNYEEYFLLYADNELCAADKDIVAAFVADNPDLKEELQMLLQTITTADDIVYSDKDSLLKPALPEAEIEEQLLLLLDNELTGKEKQQVISLTRDQEPVKQEWLLLQQTKLPEEVIIFEDKHLLYREEAKEPKIIPFRWWQMAAAAMLIGAGLWGTVSYFNRSGGTGTESNTAVNTPATKPSSTNGSHAVTTIDTTSAASTINQQPAVVAATVPSKNEPSTSAAIVANKKQPQIKREEEPRNVAALQPVNNNSIPGGSLQKINTIESNKIVATTVEPSTKIELPDHFNIPKNEYAINTAAVENDDMSFNEEEQDDKPKKTKLGGFFKKMKRTFERKTKIRTGSGEDVKIANMSFAMH